MSFSLAIFLGLIQGLTEFLPVSSSGHLVLLQKIFGILEPPIFFDVLVHLGTLGAVLLFFRGEIVRVFREFEGFKKIVIGTVPVVVVGLVVQPFVETIFGSLPIVGAGFFVTAALLLWSKRLASGHSSFKELTNLQAFTIGCFQAVALIPGISRSGATIVGGLSQKLDRDEAFRFSFYLSIPAIIGANILQLKNLSSLNFLPQSFLGMVVAFAVGLLSLKFLQRILEARRLYYFSFYCLFPATLALLLGLVELDLIPFVK